MLTTDEAKLALTEIKTITKEAEAALGIETLKKELSEMQGQMEAPGFWDNVTEAHKVNKKIRPIEDKLEQFSKIILRMDDAAVMLELVDESGDVDMAEELTNELAMLRIDVTELKLKALLRGEYDANGAILSLHAGACGT
jgi:peptide chain release factor 2